MLVESCGGAPSAPASSSSPRSSCPAKSSPPKHSRTWCCASPCASPPSPTTSSDWRPPLPLPSSQLRLSLEPMNYLRPPRLLRNTLATLLALRRRAPRREPGHAASTLRAERNLYGDAVVIGNMLAWTTASITARAPIWFTLGRARSVCSGFRLARGRSCWAKYKFRKCFGATRCISKSAVIRMTTVSLFADGEFVQRWKDAAGFVAKGSGIVFFRRSIQVG